MLVLIRGAGDLASGIALRLHHAHLSVVMTDLPQPTAIRRTVCFSQAIVYGSMTVEDVTARFCAAPENAAAILAAGERVLRAPADGIFVQKLEIGASVHTGDVAGTVNGVPMLCQIDGMLRGILPDGTPVTRGMKSGDVDPRGKREYCDLVSDKALAIGGGVLEAILSLTGALRA